jgi:hypothetical protein
MAEPDPTTKVVIDISGESSSDHVILEDQQHNKKSSLISTVNKTESVTQVTLVTENIKKNGQSVHVDEKNKLDLTSPIQRGTSRESVKSHNSTEPQLTEEV